MKIKTGGASGADYLWTLQALKHKCEIEIMSFKGHSSSIPNGITPTYIQDEKLEEVLPYVDKVCKLLKRKCPDYAYKLIARNFYIVNDVEAVYAVGYFNDSNLGLGIDGGTAWGCEYFKILYNDRLIYFYDMNSNSWYCDSDKIIKPPSPLTYNKVGLIGSRNITQSGINAINNVFL